MRIRWTIPSADDLESIRDYLRERSPSFAESTVRDIYARVLSLKQFPDRGRPGRRPGTRELILTPLTYLVVYQVKIDSVEVLHISHGSRNRESIS